MKAKLLHPADFASPSGEYVLHVDPSHREGSGPASYRMRRDEEVVWERELPLTLWKPTVTDAGQVVGYAYSNGYENLREPGVFHTVLLGVSGDVLRDDAMQRGGSFAHEAPKPLGGRVVVHAGIDRALIQVVSFVFDDRLPWKCYRLSTGGRLDDWHPPSPVEIARRQAISVRDARAVPSTDLVLIRWWFWDNAANLEGDVFSLVNPAGEMVWKLEQRERSNGAPTVFGSIRSVTSDGFFTLGLASDGVLATFGVRSGTDGWEIAPGSSEPYTPSEKAAAEKTDASVLAIELESLGKTQLLAPGEQPEGPIRDIAAFGFTGAGNVEFIRERSGPVERDYLRLKPNGEVDFVTPILPVEGVTDGALRTWFDGIGDEWFVVLTDLSHADRPRQVHRVDVRTGASEEVPGIDWPDFPRIVATPSGGFLLLGDKTLLAVGPDDELRWKRSATDRLAAGELYSPADVTVTRDGLVVVVDSTRGSLQLFSDNGAYLRSLDLSVSWGDSPRSPATVRADGEGGVWIAGGVELKHVTLDGELLHSWAPKFADGRDLEEREFQPGPAGRIWSTDGTVIASLDASGEPGAVLGAAPSTTSLRTPSEAHIDALGRVFVLDQHSETWHVFGSDGAHLFACPAPSTFSRAPAVDVEGNIYIQQDDDVHLAYDATGKRLESVALGGWWVRFLPNAHQRWVSRWYKGSLQLLDDAGVEISRLERRPDDRYWTNLRGVHVSADGSTLAVLESDEQSDYLAVYDAQGRAGRLFDLGGERRGGVRASAEWALICSSHSSVLMVNLADGSLHRFRGWNTVQNWEWDFSPNGRELWGVDISRLTLHRWALPG